MADGRLRAMRSLVVAQATFFGSSASADQVADFIDTGWLACTPSGGEPPPIPYDHDALKALVSSGKLG